MDNNYCSVPHMLYHVSRDCTTSKPSMLHNAAHYHANTGNSVHQVYAVSFRVSVHNTVCAGTQPVFKGSRRIVPCKNIFLNLQTGQLCDNVNNTVLGSTDSNNWNKANHQEGD